MKKRGNVWLLSVLLLLGASVMLFGCGGGGGGGAVGSSGADGAIAGTAVKGPVRGATVEAFAVLNGTMGLRIGAGLTDAEGNYAVPIGAYSGPVMLRMSGGSYIDEATGVLTPMGPNSLMTGVMPYAVAGAVTGGVQITPLTSMAQAMAQAMSGGMTPANIEAANAAIGAYFSIADILHTRPMNPLIPGSGGAATEAMRHYGLVLAGLSEYARGMGMAVSSEIVAAMMEDASDGILNGWGGDAQVTVGGRGGMMGYGPLSGNAGSTGWADAMASFMGSTLNRSGLTVTDMQALHDQMAASHGQIW